MVEEKEVQKEKWILESCLLSKYHYNGDHSFIFIYVFICTFLRSGKHYIYDCLSEKISETQHLFPEKPERGGSEKTNPGASVHSPYQKPCTKALGKDGILITHERSSMHQLASERVDRFTLI